MDSPKGSKLTTVTLFKMNKSPGCGFSEVCELCTSPVVHEPLPNFMSLVPKCMDKNFLCVRRRIGLFLVLYLLYYPSFSVLVIIVVPTKK